MPCRNRIGGVSAPASSPGCDPAWSLIVRSLISQRLDRIEARRAPSRIERRQQRQRERHDDHRRGLADIENSAVLVSQEMKRRIDSMLRHTSSANRKPTSVPTTPTEAPVIMNTRMMAP